MADKKALFAGRSGDRSSGTRSGSSTADTTPPPPSSRVTEVRRSPPSYQRGAGARGVERTEERRAAQLKEAEESRKAANKCLQKTMTRWNPNYFSAAPLFEKAANCYRAAGREADAIAMFMTAGECQSHESVEAHASAAKDFREAALITERQGSNDEAAALYMRCAEAWVQADESGRAAEFLARSARLIEDTDEGSAVERYVKTAKVMVPDGVDEMTDFTRVVGGADNLVQAIRYLASKKRLKECIEVVERYCVILRAEAMQHSLNRMYLTYCILALAQGDYVKAEAAFRDVHLQNTKYLRSEECRIEEDLLMAFRDFKADLLQRAQKERTLKLLEPAVVHLARSLRIAGDEGTNADDLGQGERFAQGRGGSTIADVHARVGALKAKHGMSASPGKISTSSSQLHHHRPTPSLSPVVEGAASYTAADSNDALNGADAETGKEELFGGASKAPAPTTASPSTAGGGHRSSAATDGGLLEAAPPGKQGEATSGALIDLDLADLETSVAHASGGSGGGEAAPGSADDDDLDAAIEAAKREMGLLELDGPAGGAQGPGYGGEDGDQEDEDDIDLT